MIVFVQEASSEWFLAVQIQDYENMYNTEIKNNEYCCCDNPEGPCGNGISAIKSTPCNSQLTCQPYYVLRVNFQGCPSTDPMMCSVSELTDTSVVHTFVTTSFLPHLHVTLNQSELEMYNQVRKCD